MASTRGVSQSALKKISGFWTDANCRNWFLEEGDKELEGKSDDRSDTRVQINDQGGFRLAQNYLMVETYGA